MIWSHPGMSTYFRNERGRIVTNSPWRLIDYWRLTREADLRDFHTVPPVHGDDRRPDEASGGFAFEAFGEPRHLRPGAAAA